MFDRFLPYLRRHTPAAASLMLGSQEQCQLCSRWISSTSRSESWANKGESKGAEGLTGATGLDLTPRIQALQRHLCRRCLTSIPWIREIRCEGCGRAMDCPDCARRRSPALLLNRAAVRYNSTMKDWLAAYKYRGHERLQFLISVMLEYAYEQLLMKLKTTNEIMRKSTDERRGSFYPLLTAVPLSDRRLQERGFNQAERLAEHLAARYKLDYAPLLQRIRHTNRQSHKSRRERLQDLRGAFVAAPAAEQICAGTGKRPYDAIVIVDDVYTTGSTLHECAKVLREAAGMPIYSITWAR